MKYIGYILLGLAAVLWLGPVVLAIVDLTLWFTGAHYQVIDWDDGKKAWTSFVAIVTICMLLSEGLS